MINFQQDVKDWMILAGQEIPNKPTVPSKEVIDLRIKLIQEELDELKENPTDLVNAADAFADLLYVVYGAAISYGLDINPIWAEVHRSNMTKFIDGYRREDGKWTKGPSYSPANLEKVIYKCIECDGTGVPKHDYPYYAMSICSKCGGNGKVEK